MLEEIFTELENKRLEMEADLEQAKDQDINPFAPVLDDARTHGMTEEKQVWPPIFFICNVVSNIYEMFEMAKICFEAIVCCKC